MFFIIEMLQEVLQNNNLPDVEHPKPLVTSKTIHIGEYTKKSKGLQTNEWMIF